MDYILRIYQNNSTFSIPGHDINDKRGGNDVEEEQR